MTDELWFANLAAIDDVDERAPARLKSRLYSALVNRMAESASLLDLRESRRAGGKLCVFEHCLRPLDKEIRSMNPCRICHARALGERMSRAPIYWPGCPYSDFHKG